MANWNRDMIAINLSSPLLLPSPKTCATCNTKHFVTTDDAVICKRGLIWFNCPCGSTLVAKKRCNAREIEKFKRMLNHRSAAYA
jgi:hypothetical protein